MTNSTPKSSTTADPAGGPVREDHAVLRLLRAQRDALRQLDALGPQQQQCVRAQQTQPLVALLEQRRRLIDRLKQLNDDLDQHRAPAQALVLPIPHRDEAAALVLEIERLRGRVLARDRDDVDALTERRDELGRRVREAAHADKAVRAYRGPDTADARNRFADRTG